MPNFIQATTSDAPDFLSIARGVYGDAFASSSRPELEDAVAEWSALTVAEQGFATAHLLFLSIEAQAATQSLLEDVRDALEDLQINAEQATGVVAELPTTAPSPMEEKPQDDFEVLPPVEEDDDLDDTEEDDLDAPD